MKLFNFKVILASFFVLGIVAGVIVFVFYFRDEDDIKVAGLDISRKTTLLGSTDSIVEAASNDKLIAGLQSRRSGDGIENVGIFISEFEEIDGSLSGLDLRKARLELVERAYNGLDLDGFRELVDQLRGKVYYSYVSSRLASRFAKEDPDQGLKWLIDESAWDDSSSAPMAFASSYQFESFPAEVLNEIVSNKKKMHFIQGLLSNSSSAVARDALAYLNANPEVRRLNGNMIPNFFDDKLNRGEFVESLELVRLLEDPIDKDQSLRKIFEKVAISDPQQAKVFLEGIDDRPERVTAIISISKNWGQTQPDKVAEWVDQIGDVVEQDAAREGLVRAITNIDPASALEWARSIQDEIRREAVLGKLEETLSITHPELLR